MARGSMRASDTAFASNADGTLTVIHQDTPDQYQVVQNLQTAPASRSMGLDPATHRVFVVSAKFGTFPAGGRRCRAAGFLLVDGHRARHAALIRVRRHSLAGLDEGAIGGDLDSPLSSSAS